MKGFVFRLERLLELRSTAERERAQALGQAVRKEETQRQALDEASERLGSCGAQISDVLDNVAPAGSLTNLRLAIEAAMREVDSASLSHQAALDQMQQERELFSQARVERRVVERLREKRRAAWTEEASRVEQSESDSVARNRRSTSGRSR
jgi:flagellar export protein FliJ